MTRDELKDHIRTEVQAVADLGGKGDEMYRLAGRLFNDISKEHPGALLWEALGDLCHDEARRMREMMEMPPPTAVGLVDFVRATTPDITESSDQLLKREAALQRIRGEVWKRLGTGQGPTIGRRISKAIEMLLLRKYNTHLEIPPTITFADVAEEFTPADIRSVLGAGTKSANAWERIRNNGRRN